MDKGMLLCTVCGGRLQVDRGLPVTRCVYCGSPVLVPAKWAEKGDRYDMVNDFCQKGDFQAAEEVCDQLLLEDGADPEAYFRRALSRYGVRYRRDPQSREWEPYCSRWRRRTILQEPDFLCAMELADPLAQVIYRQMGERIDKRWKEGRAAGGVLLFYKLGQDGAKRLEKQLMGGKEGRKKPKESVLMADHNTPWVLGGRIKRQDISRISFFGSLAHKPSDSWDVSADKDKSIAAWVKPDGDKYELYVSAEGRIRANANSYGLFQGYSSLEEICFNHCFYTSGVTNMAFLFGGCRALRRLDVRDFDTSQVTDMSGMFEGCASLPALDISGFDTIRVANMSCMFDGCASLSKLDARNLETVQVVNMSCMFNGCSSLLKLDVRDFDTAQVTDMSCMFNGCGSLLKLDVKDFDTSRVRDMSYMFYGCSNLIKLDVSRFRTSRVEDMRGMFYNCSSLLKLDTGGFDKSNVKEDTLMLAGTRWG